MKVLNIAYFECSECGTILRAFVPKVGPYCTVFCTDCIKKHSVMEGIAPA